MQYVYKYNSPLGEIIITADEYGINGLRLCGQKHFTKALNVAGARTDESIFKNAISWLDEYFSGRDPGEPPAISLKGTEFELKVWRALLNVKYGSTLTYGEIARIVSPHKKMSAQAVGGAVGRNPVSIMVPCHRIIGADGNLTGYDGGLDKKIFLLKTEGIYTFYNAEKDKYFVIKTT